MSDHSPRKSEGSESANAKPSLRIVWIFLALLLAYPLSIGPVQKCYQNHAAPQAIETFYKPIKLLYRTNVPTRQLVDWYLALWGVHR
jgi:hypothetical protein